VERAEAEAIYEQGRDAVVTVLLALSAQNERLEAQVESLTARVARQDERIAQLPAARRPTGHSGGFMSRATRHRGVGYRLGAKASAIRASNSFFTSFFGSGLWTGKWSDPLVFVYPSVSLASCGITEPLCGR
jgi:hypothetical protein